MELMTIANIFAYLIGLPIFGISLFLLLRHLKKSGKSMNIFGYKRVKRNKSKGKGTKPKKSRARA